MGRKPKIPMIDLQQQFEELALCNMSPLTKDDPRASKMSRVTREGRKLDYALRVIQQPERARACGSGAKSSADRRPVDPPPVVELRIFEENGADVTFSHNANFILFATLEHARPIAHGRVPAATGQTQAPVLTGIPVSSMAYLDRPEPAGYFIFPDLSVRHEGRYKLVFNLYEESKEAKDEDAKPAHSHPELATNPNAPKEFQHWRLEAQSEPFSVYSAKKFPGLAESTALSRIVAEQGCRVRIRRDVRMRRRETKSGKDFEEYDDEPSYSAGPDASQPDNFPGQDTQRAPAPANPSVEPQYPVDRRQSSHEQSFYGQQQQPHQYPQQVHHQPQQGYQTSAASQQLPQMGYAPPPSLHQQHQQAAFGPPQFVPQVPPFAQQQHYQPNQYASYQEPAPQPTSGYAYPERPQYDQAVPSTEHKSVDEWRQSTYPQPSYSAKPTEYGYGAPNYNGYMQPPPAPRVPTPSSNGPLPPIKMPLPVDTKYDNAGSPSGQGNSQHVPLPSPAYDQNYIQSAQSSQPARTPAYPHYSETLPSTTASPEASRTTKRPFGSAFDESQLDQPLSNGARPNESAYGADALSPENDDDDSDNSFNIPIKMQYKRADGTEISRRLATLR